MAKTRQLLTKRDREMLSRNVQRGVDYLNANPDKEDAFEEWFRRLDIATLNVASGLNCVMGQLLGEYSRLVYVDDFDQKPDGWLTRWAESHGFLARDRYVKWDRPTNRYVRVRPTTQRELNSYYVDHAYRDAVYATLTDLWREAVTTTQLAHSVPQSLVDVTES